MGLAFLLILPFRPRRWLKNASFIHSHACTHKQNADGDVQIDVPGGGVDAGGEILRGKPRLVPTLTRWDKIGNGGMFFPWLSAPTLTILTPINPH
jgi:hypothetical protein